MGKHHGGKVAVTTLVAAGLGYAVGILTAPKSGKETRKDIQKAALKAKTEAERKLKSLHSELNQMITKAKSQASKAGSKAKKELTTAIDKAQRAAEKARLILSALHEGSAEDKDLKKAIEDMNKAMANLKKFMGKPSRAKVSK